MRSGSSDAKVENPCPGSDPVRDARLAALRDYCVLDTAPEARFDDLTCLAASICGTPISLVSLVDAERLFFKSAHGTDVREVPYPDGFCGHAIRQREILEVCDTLEDARFATHPLVVDSPKIRFYAGAPLVTPQGVAIGTLCVMDFAPRRLNDHHRLALEILARQVIAQLELNLLAIRDPLTGLYNRRALEDSLGREILRASRSRLPIGVMAIDVDHFKRVNDTHGHEAGDTVLRAIAAELMGCVRAEDISCRSGGEEFTVILPRTDENTLVERAETVRNRVEQAVIAAGGHTVCLTVSIGLAVYPAHGEREGELLRAADAALYRAKADGRNRIVMCPGR